MAEAKRRLRERMGALRRGVAKDVARAAGEAVAKLAGAESAVSAARRVGLYASLDDELPTRALFETLLAAGRPLLLPHIRGPRLDWSVVEGWAELAPGRFGILEPRGASVAAPGSEDLVFIPGLAFDTNGFRLGRGGGYYDRAFGDPETGPTLVGVAYAFQCVEAVPRDSRDRRVDAIVTEREWIWTPCGNRGRK